MRRLVIGALVYFLWQERNSRIFSKKIRSPKQLCAELIEEIRYKLMSLSWKDSRNVRLVKDLWKIA